MKILKKSHNFKYKLIIFFVSLTYSLLLTFQIPINETINDRLNYLIFIKGAENIFFNYFEKGILNFFFNEPLWSTIIIFFKVFLTSENIIRAIVLFSSFVSSYLILKVDNRYFIFLLILLFFPGIIDKFVVHLRNGFAITIFLIGWFSISKFWRIVFFGLSPLIHSSFFIIILIYLFNVYFKKINWLFNKIRIDIFLIVTTSILLSIIIILNLAFFAEILGARQIDHKTYFNFNLKNISGMGFLFWLIVLFLYLLEGKNFILKNSFQIFLILFYLISYFTLNIGIRIFESALIIVILCSLDLNSWRKICFFSIFSFYMLSVFIIRINKPYFGWGIS